MAKRWVCPTCSRGVNAPERLRKIDVRRYCLDCSKATGILVERTVPARDAARARRAEARKAAAALQAERKAARRSRALVDADGRTVRLDLDAEVHRALREMGYKGKVKVEVTAHHSGRGHAWPEYSPPEVSLSPDESLEATLELVYHEAAHVAAGASRGRTGRAAWHGPKFRATLRDALQARWPFLVYGSIHEGEAYASDREIVAQLKLATLDGVNLLAETRHRSVILR